MVLHPSIYNTLQNAVIRRNQKHLRRQEYQKEKLTPSQYHKMRNECNNTTFLPKNDADTTKVNIYYITMKFQR